MLMSWLANIACEVLMDQKDFVLVTVLSKSGSAPCLAGAKMVVFADGTSIGSVGGGVLEAAAQKKAARIFKSKSAEVMNFNLAGKDAASMQMICGGNVKLLIDYIPASTADIVVFGKLRDFLNRDRKCYMVTALSTTGTPSLHSLILEDKETFGDFPFPQDWKSQLIKLATRSTYPVSDSIDNQRFIVERCYIPSTLYIFGAGHISQQLAKLAAMCDFQTIVVDDREEYANKDRFPNADTIEVLDSFDNSFINKQIDGDSYIVIVTRGHQHDNTVLKQALSTNAGYIGMMGSKTKRNELFKKLTLEGYSSDQLGRVHSPIGLSIKAATMGEIAVSIMAELIQVRAETKPKS